MPFHIICYPKTIKNNVIFDKIFHRNMICSLIARIFHKFLNICIWPKTINVHKSRFAHWQTYKSPFDVDFDLAKTKKKTVHNSTNCPTFDAICESCLFAQRKTMCVFFFVCIKCSSKNGALHIIYWVVQRKKIYV